MPVSLAWDAFGEGNGARSLAEVKQRIGRYRRSAIGPGDNPDIGCIVLVEPFFFAENDWIPCPTDFTLNTVAGKGYEMDSTAGRAVWDQVVERLDRQRAFRVDPGPATVGAVETARYGAPTIVMPRLGQGTFRVMVTDAYGRRCAISNERTLPVLEAAHIRPYSENGPHQLSNGLLLRSDLHTLFDLGYVTVDPDKRCTVISSRIREEFENGRDYYRFHGMPMATPKDPSATPAREFLAYHAERVFK